MPCRLFNAELAKRAPVKMTAAEVLEFLRAIAEVIAQNVAPGNVIRIPQLATFRVRFQKPRPARTGRISGKEFVAPAKPLTAVLKVTTAHELQKAVSKRQEKEVHFGVAAVDEGSETQPDTVSDVD